MASVHEPSDNDGHLMRQPVTLPVRGDPRTWCLMVKVGKILMRIGLLFRVIRNVSPLAALNI